MPEGLQVGDRLGFDSSRIDIRQRDGGRPDRPAVEDEYDDRACPRASRRLQRLSSGDLAICILP
jgi:hypothetical protein